MAKYLDYDGLVYLWGKLKTELNGKVDKVQGKGLSTNDFDDTYKAKLDSIAASAQTNVIETVKVDGSALTPDANKAVNIVLSGKVDVEVGKGLSTNDFDNTYKDKLDSIAASAQTNVIEKVKVGGTELSITSKSVDIVAASGVTTSSGVIAADLKDYTKNASAAGDKATTGSLLPVELDSNAKLAVKVPAATVTGVKSGEKILALDGTELTSTLSIAIEKSGATQHDHIVLKGINGEVVAAVDANDFVVDGMLSSVTYDGTAHTMTFTWNTDAGSKVTTIDLDDVIAPYTAGSGVSIANNEVSVKLAGTQGNVTLSFDGTDKGLKASIDLSDYATTADTAAIEGALTAHTNNGDIHVTSTQKTNWQDATDKLNASAATWNSAAQQLSDSAATWNTTANNLTAHTNNGDIHVTSTQKTNWQDATDKLNASAATWNSTSDLVSASADTWNTHAEHALVVTNGQATAAGSLEITYVESVSGCPATSGDLTATTVRKTVTIPNPTVNDGALTIKVTSGNTDTDVAEFTANQSGNTSIKFIAADDIVITPDATNNTITIGENINALTTTDIDNAIAQAES